MRIDSYEFDEEAIVIPGEGGIGEIFHFVEGKYALHQRAYRISFRSLEIDTKYAFYYFSTHFKQFILQKAVSATVTSIRKPMIMEFEIPVPPLEVQREIVRILDQFTQLETELGAELEARRQQYDHYRNEMLTFTEGAHYVPLGDLCSSITTGKLDVNARVEGGKYPFFTCDARPYSIDTWAFDAEAILLSGNGSRVGHVSYYHGKFNAYQRTYILTHFSKQITVPYLLHYLSAFFRNYVSIKSRKGSVPYITLPMLKAFSIPLPILDQQNKIVQILDSFDALVNDPSIGLPAELAARRKQYEHYRDRLLTFDKAVV
jgi:type I restriction enzyme S subunit